MSCGPRAKRRRQRRASTMRAVESAPPDTARMIRPERGNDANSRAISRCEIATAASAVDTLLFPLDRLPDAQRGAGVFAADLRQRAARRVFFAQLPKGLTEPQQCVGRLGGGGVIPRNKQE